MNTYAIADLHGRFDLAKAAVAAIEARAQEPGTIVWLGDYIDRGPESRQLIEFLMAGPQTEGWEWEYLRGNHEDMMIQCLSGQAPLRWWIGNGGGATMMSYGQKVGEEVRPEIVPLQHLLWMATLPFMVSDEYRIFVHAGVDPTIPIADQDVQTLLWMRYQAGFQEGHGDRHVVHGHTPEKDGPLVFSGRTNLDTLAWATGRLVVGVYDDEVPGAAVDYIEVKLPSIQELAA